MLASETQSGLFEARKRITFTAGARPAPLSCTALVHLDTGEKLTVHIEPRGARVQPGDTRDREDQLPTCLVRLSSEAWRAVCRQERPLLGGDLDVLGDPRALSALGGLLTHRVSPLESRFLSNKKGEPRSRLTRSVYA